MKHTWTVISRLHEDRSNQVTLMCLDCGSLAEATIRNIEVEL